MIGLSSIYIIQDLIRSSHEYSEIYFKELNKFRIDNDIDTNHKLIQDYLDGIFNQAFYLHNKAQQFRDKKIYYEAKKDRIVSSKRYEMASQATFEYFEAISDLNDFLKNNEIDSRAKFNSLKIKVELYSDKLSSFAAQYFALRREYLKYVLSLLSPTSVG